MLTASSFGSSRCAPACFGGPKLRSTPHLRCRWSSGAPPQATSSSSGEAFSGGAEESGSIQETIHNLDMLLGLDGSAAAEPAAVEPAAAAALPSEAPLPPEWAHLPADEVFRRRILVQRREKLGQRQAALQQECEEQERKLAAQQQRLALLQHKLRQLTVYRQELQDLIDPEAAAALRAAAAERVEKADRLARRDVFVMLGCLIALYGLAATSLAHEVAQRRRQPRETCFYDDP